MPEQYLFLMLAPGPVLGLWSMRHLVFVEAQNEEHRQDENIGGQEERISSVEDKGLP